MHAKTLLRSPSIESGIGCNWESLTRSSTLLVDTVECDHVDSFTTLVAAVCISNADHYCHVQHYSTFIFIASSPCHHVISYRPWEPRGCFLNLPRKTPLSSPAWKFQANSASTIVARIMARSKGVPLPVTPKVHAPSRGASCILSNPKDGTSEFDGLCFGLIIEDIGCNHDSVHERIGSTYGFVFCADNAFVFITHFDSFCTLFFCNCMHGSPLQCTGVPLNFTEKSPQKYARGVDSSSPWTLPCSEDWKSDLIWTTCDNKSKRWCHWCILMSFIWYLFTIFHLFFRFRPTAGDLQLEHRRLGVE